MTATDFYGYGRQVPYADPNPILDTRHRHLLAFRFGGEDGRDDFDVDSNGALTFAARTTSCIPGVFPPVSFGALEGWLGSDRPVDFERLEQRLLPALRAGEVPGRLDVVRRRRRPRQQAVRPGDRGDPGAPRRGSGRPPPAVPRAGSRRRTEPVAPERALDGGRGDRRPDRSPPLRADPRRPGRDRRAERTGSADSRHHRDELGHGRGARQGDRRATAGDSGRPGGHEAHRHPQAHRGGGAPQRRLQLRDLRAPEDQRRRRPLRANRVRRLRPPARLDARAPHAECASALGGERNLFEQRIEPGPEQLDFLVPSTRRTASGGFAS